RVLPSTPKAFSHSLGGKPMIVAATRNKKKLVEIITILEHIGVPIADLSAWPAAPDVVEDGSTFAENARKKAEQIAQAVGHWTLGEDSGLVVPALKGRPGIYSARYAGTHGDDTANNARLLA